MMATYFQLIEKFLNIDTYNVPKDVEDVWKQTIVNNLLEEIKKTKGYEKSSKVTKLIAIYGHYNNIQLLEELLDDNTLDTFSKILYLEGLNREKLGVNISIKYKILKIDDPKLYIEALNEKNFELQINTFK